MDSGPIIEQTSNKMHFCIYQDNSHVVIIENICEGFQNYQENSLQVLEYPQIDVDLEVKRFADRSPWLTI